MGDSPHDTRQTLLMIKEILVDPVNERLDSMGEKQEQQHKEIMEQLSELKADTQSLESRSLSAATAHKLRALASEVEQEADPLIKKTGLLKTIVRNPAAPWIVAMAVALLGVGLVVIILTGHTVHGVIGTAPGP